MLQARKPVKVVGIDFKKAGQAYDSAAGTGDFKEMIKEPGLTNALFIFNDNTSGMDDQNNEDKGGNAAIRPEAWENCPRALGIPTGPGWGNPGKCDGLDVIDSKVGMPASQIIDNTFESLYFLLHVRPEIDTVFFSRESDKPVRLGKSLFLFGDDVRDYITEKLLALEKGIKPLESIDSAALKQALPNRVALFSKLPSRTPASVGTLRIPTLLSHTCMPSLRCSLFLCAQVNSPPAQKANAASQPLPADAVSKPLLSRQSRYGAELVGRYILLKSGVWHVLRFDSAVTKEHVCTNAEGREERFFLGSKNAVLDIVPTEKEKPCEYRDLPWIKSDGSGKETERISFAKCEPSGPGDETYGRVLVALMPTCKMGEPDREDTDSKLLFTEMRNWTKSLNAARVALLAAEENAEISSVEELESHVTHRLARVMRVDPLDAASTPVHTLLIIGAHGSEHKPGSICFRPGGAPQDVRALASRIRSLLPGPLRPYLTHIHFDACTALDGVAPLPGMVLTGYDIAVGYESSRELTKHIVAAFKRAAENTEAGLDSVHGKAVADELTKMRNDFGPPEGKKGLGGNASGESAKANVDGFTIADLAQHLLILWEAPVKVRDAEICEARWHTHAACESFAHLRGRTVYKFTRLSHAIAASPIPSWAHATSTSQRMMTDVIRATPRRQERKTTIASHSRCSLPIFRI